MTETFWEEVAGTKILRWENSGLGSNPEPAPSPDLNSESESESDHGSSSALTENRIHNTNNTRVIAEAARIIRNGGLVAFPTETVYGLGAGVFYPGAVERIFQAKGRPLDNPCIAHLYHVSQVQSLAVDPPAELSTLAAKYWPGPLTLILQRRPEVPSAVSAGMPTIAVRIPQHPAALHFLREAGTPVAAPSANVSGRLSPTAAHHVIEELAGHIDAILDGGSCPVGVESTVLDLTQTPPVLLRPGAISREDLENCLQQPVTLPSGQELSPPASPGMKYRHYAPHARLLLFKGHPEEMRQRMQEYYTLMKKEKYRVGILCTRENAKLFPEAEVEVLSRQGEAEEAAASLYRALRDLDSRGVDIILAESFPETGIGLALVNRLEKAAAEII